MLPTMIPRKPAVTTTPKYRCSLNQVSNPRYRTGVKPKPWFKPQLWNWPCKCLQMKLQVTHVLSRVLMCIGCSGEDAGAQFDIMSYLQVTEASAVQSVVKYLCNCISISLLSISDLITFSDWLQMTGRCNHRLANTRNYVPIVMLSSPTWRHEVTAGDAVPCEQTSIVGNQQLPLLIYLIIINQR